MAKVRGGCFNPARFYNSSSSSSACGRASAGLCSSSRSSSSVFFIRLFHGIDLPSVRSSSILGGDRDRDRRIFFEKAARPFFPSSMLPRCFSSITKVALVDEETQVTSRLSSSPWLMVPPGLVSNSSSVEEEEEAAAAAAFENDYFHLYNVSEKKMLNIKRNNKIRLLWQRDILSANEAICVGSSHGWLAFSHPHNCSLFLFNPLLLSSSEFPYFPLPPVETLPSVISSVRRRKEDRDLSSSSSSSIVIKYSIPWESPVSAQELSDEFVRKVVLSSAPFPFLSNCDHPHQQDIIVMAILGHRENILAFCRLGDMAWTTLDAPLNHYNELVYFSKDQRFYALSSGISIEAWDLRDPASPKSSLKTHLAPPVIQPTMDERQRHLRKFSRPSRKKYLVESSSGDLLMVIRYHVPCDDDGRIDHNNSRAHKTVAFDVYKLDFVNNKWVYVTCLEDEALFVGENDCFSLSASHFPGLSKNSIYFTPFCFLDTAVYGGEDMGIYSLGDGSITPFFHCDFKKNQPPPVWIIPQSQPHL